MKSKICNKCNLEKDINDFGKSTGIKSEFIAICKGCLSNYAKSYYNTEEKLNKRRIDSLVWYHKNRVRLIALNKAKKEGKDHKIYLLPKVKNPIPLWKINKEKSWNKIGIKNFTYVEYEKMVIEQNNKCYLCEKTEFGKELAPDHCHKTGKIRKLLCFNCNTSIGKLGDDVKSITKVLNYLKEYE